MRSLSTLIAGRVDRRHELAILGTSDPDGASRVIEQWCEANLGSITNVLFYRCSSGIVVGLELGARQMVLKVHQPHIDQGRLEIATQVQQLLFEQGFPAPEPLCGPTPLGLGQATAEAYCAGNSADGHDPDVRRTIANGLCKLIRIIEAEGFAATPSSATLMRPTPPDGLWSTPHDPRFDFERSTAGAEWIDELAAGALVTLRSSEVVECVAHFDWRVENLAFAGSDLVAVYDWDSIGLAPEAVAVGQASAHFSTDWSVGPETIPSVVEMARFVGDYEAARDRSFSIEERDLIEAANLMVLAYIARCEHSDLVLNIESESQGMSTWANLLRDRSKQTLLF